MTANFCARALKPGSHSAPFVLHPKLDKFLLRPLQGVFLEFPALEKNADLAGSFPFGLLDGASDPIVFELANKPVRAHSKITNSSRRLRRQSCLHHR
jgi:hypothetical protein